VYRSITAPDLVRGGKVEHSIKHVRDIRPLNGSLFVGMGARLFADQVHLTHQLTYLESPIISMMLRLPAALGLCVNSSFTGLRKDELATDASGDFAFVFSEVGDGFEIRHQTPGQPHQLNVALSFSL
jgi:hypothetical protein